MRTIPIAVLLLLAATPPASAQLVADTLFEWRGYASLGTCRVRLYRPAAGIEREGVVVLQELAENRGPSTVDDIGYLAEEVGRSLGLDPADVYWIVHWGAFSFEGAGGDRGKELFLRATFRRGAGGSLGAPQWRLLFRDEVIAYTDRAFR